MSGGPGPAGYRAEVRAKGPVFGTDQTVGHVLGTFWTISPVLALRWLQSEALRLADRLDPDPARSAWVRPSMRKAAVPLPDCPAELRVWATDPGEWRAARDLIRGGRPLSVAIPDADCTYTLSLRPARLPTTGRPDPSPPEQLTLTHRTGGLPHSLYESAEDPWR
ncbi:hypothetical protein ACFC09_19365 [Streptomyces sp. NPDC056161]|uniref:hypothetical protein n=1 Tax=unclassified Streptomyces TaxID=2593676 RepID=UPI0035DFFFF4